MNKNQVGEVKAATDHAQKESQAVDKDFSKYVSRQIFGRPWTTLSKLLRFLQMQLTKISQPLVPGTWLYIPSIHDDFFGIEDSKLKKLTEMLDQVSQKSFRWQKDTFRKGVVVMGAPAIVINGVKGHLWMTLKMGN